MGPPADLRILPCCAYLLCCALSGRCDHALVRCRYLDLCKSLARSPLYVAVQLTFQPGIALWAADRLLRIARLFLPSLSLFSATTPLASAGTITLLTPSTIKLTLPTRTTWKAGQHFYVLLPTLSRLPWETHPFTAAGIPGDGEVSFVIRVRDGMTGRMKAAVKEGNTGSVQGRVEGPYGGSGCLRGVDGVVIFAGKFPKHPK